MKTNDKTLADAQPGGRVRLGDQAERARFEAWAESEGEGIGRWPDGFYIRECTQVAWKSWKAALSAQPSPGGQGDALAAINRVVEQLEDMERGCRIHPDYLDDARVAQDALAARQPVRIYGCCAQPEGELHTAECPNMRHLAARQPVGQIPAGFVLVPEKFGIPADVWESVEFVIGGPGTGEGDAYLDSTAWVGDLIQDDGSAVYGLHLSCDECPEEGSVTLSVFTARAEVQP